MAKEIKLKNNRTFTDQFSNVLDRDQLEYTGEKIFNIGGKLFWSSALVLSAVTIYASLVYLVAQQLRK